MGMWLNAGCGTHRAPEPWVNIDVVEREDVHPDVIVTPGEPWPFDDGAAERVYCGHVLEHMNWDHVRGFLEDVRRVLQPGGELLVVGPDVLRTIERYKRGLEPQFMVHTVIEYHDRNEGFVNPDWDGARHHWNCWSARVAGIVEIAGFTDVREIDPPDGVVPEGWFPPWPVVHMAPWQCAVHARA